MTDDMNKPNVPVSVIIPHYNRSHFITAALASIREQTVKVAEIIIVDDASLPEHRRRLFEFADVVRVICLDKNGGPAHARNVGIRAAQCDYLAFLDDDDLWLPDKLKIQWRLLTESQDLSAVTSAVTLFHDDGTPSSVMEGHSPDIMTLEAALEGTPALIQTMLVRAPVVRALNGFDAGFQQFEDQEFWIRLMAAGYRVKHLRTPLVQVRRGTHQSLTTHWWSYHSSRLKVIEKHWRLYNEVLGAGGARRTASKQIRRAGIGRGGVFGRVVYAAGCIFGNELRPLVGLAATGRLSDVPYSRNGDAIAGA